MNSFFFDNNREQLSVNPTTIFSGNFKLPGIILGVCLSLLSVSFAQNNISQEALPFQALDQAAVANNLREVRMQMQYPDWAISEKKEGKIVVGIKVNEKGEYESHRILASVHPELTKVIEEHLSDLRFRPAEKDGQYVSSWVSIPFSFRLVNSDEQNLREAKDYIYLRRKQRQASLVADRP